jgi:hypothetical protein
LEGPIDSLSAFPRGGREPSEGEANALDEAPDEAPDEAAEMGSEWQFGRPSGGPMSRSSQLMVVFVVAVAVFFVFGAALLILTQP